MGFKKVVTHLYPPLPLSVAFTPPPRSFGDRQQIYILCSDLLWQLTNYTCGMVGTMVTWYNDKISGRRKYAGLSDFFCKMSIDLIVLDECVTSEIVHTPDVINENFVARVNAD